MKSIINDQKGLSTEQGSGLTIQNDVVGEGAGIEYVKSGIIQTLAAPADYDSSIDLPAGAMITDIGVRCTFATKTANTGAGDVVTLKIGTSAGGTQIVNDLTLLAQNEEAVAGRAVSVQMGNKFQSGGTALAFVAGDTCLLHSDTARTIHTRLIVKDTTLVSIGDMQVFLKYVVIR